MLTVDWNNDYLARSEKFEATSSRQVSDVTAGFTLTESQCSSELTCFTGHLFYSNVENTDIHLVQIGHSVMGEEQIHVYKFVLVVVMVVILFNKQICKN